MKGPFPVFSRCFKINVFHVFQNWYFTSVSSKEVYCRYWSRWFLITDLYLTCKKKKKVKWHYLPSVTGFSSKLISILAEHPTLVSGSPTVPGQDLNPGPLSFEASALLTELMRPDHVQYICSWEALYLLSVNYNPQHIRPENISLIEMEEFLFPYYDSHRCTWQTKQKNSDLIKWPMSSSCDLGESSRSSTSLAACLLKSTHHPTYHIQTSLWNFQSIIWFVNSSF